MHTACARTPISIGSIGEVRWAEAGPEARRSIDQALALQPDKPYFLVQLAQIQIKELDLTAAQQTLERLRSIAPDYRLLNQGFAILAMVRGRAEEAMRYWQKPVEQDPYNMPFPTSRYGLMLFGRRPCSGRS